MKCLSRFSYLVLPLLLLATLLSLSGCNNPEKVKAEHVSSGEAFLKAERYQEASIEFRNAIQIDDKYAAAHWGLARAYEGLQRFQEAFDEMNTAAGLDPNNLDVRVKLGNYYLAIARKSPETLKEAERIAKEILAKDANNIEGHILMGSVLFAQNERDKALAEMNTAIGLDPKRAETHLALARFYIAMGDPAKAEATFKHAIELNPKSALAHTEYGKFLVQGNRAAEAEAQFREAVDVEPTNKNSRFVLASYYLVTQQLDKAEAAYKALADIDKDRPESRAVLGDYYSAVNRVDDAIAIYQDIANRAPDFLQARYRLTEVLLSRGDVNGATNQVNELLKKDAHDRQALLLRARVHMQGGQSNDLKAAIEDLKEVLKQEPNSREGLYFMAQANFNLGLIEQARAFAGDLDRSFPNYFPAKLMQAEIAISTGDPKSALELCNQLLDRLSKATPDRDTTPQALMGLTAKAHVARGTAYAQLGNAAAARQDFTQATQIAPNDTDGWVNLAVAAQLEGKPDEAVVNYEKALSIDAVNFSALSGLAQLYGRQKQIDKAHARIDQAINAYPNNASLHFLKARVYGDQQNAQGAEAELRKTLEIDPNYIAARSSLGALFINTRQEDKAMAEYKKIVEAHPDNAATFVLMGMLEEKRKNYDGAIEDYRKALEQDSNSSVAANNLAWLYAAYGKGNLDEAVRLAQAVVQRNPTVGGFADTLGWVYYKKGLYSAAVDQLQKAVTLDEDAARKSNTPPSASYRFHLGMALAGKGDKQGAKREIEQALRTGQQFAEADEARKTLTTL